jgi:hypothetical protein
MTQYFIPEERNSLPKRSENIEKPNTNLSQKLRLSQICYYYADLQIIQKGDSDCKISVTCAEDMESYKQQEHRRQWLI